MNEQRKEILDMLAEDKITTAEADQLLTALDRDQPPNVSSLDARPKSKAKYLRVVAETMEDGEPGRINIRVPLQLLRAGVQLAALIPPRALERANAELTSSGVSVDLAQLKPDQLESLVEHLDELTIDVEQSDAKVRIFCE
ncbi:SHOCT-like domain-containing protein [Flindersiella endophytica]